MLRCLRFWLVVRVACGLFGRAGGVGSGKWACARMVADEEALEWNGLELDKNQYCLLLRLDRRLSFEPVDLQHLAQRLDGRSHVP